MPCFRIDLEYDGARFAGWAAQPGERTVEGELRQALTAVLGDELDIASAGRTDAGVHASGQVVSVASPRSFDPWRLRGALRGLLPDDVAAVAVRAAAEGFDARRDALSRSYEYRVLPGGVPSPLRRGRVLAHPGGLDRTALDACATLLAGTHDFRAFTPARSRHTRFARTILAAAWEPRDDELVFVVEADSFLHHMVRTMVGTMIEIASGDRAPDEMASLLAGADRTAAGPTAPAHPLTLVGVRYPPGV